MLKVPIFHTKYELNLAYVESSIISYQVRAQTRICWKFQYFITKYKQNLHIMLKVKLQLTNCVNEKTKLYTHVIMKAMNSVKYFIV